MLYRNGLVLALHAMACVAGFMAGSSLPTAATGYSGLWRKVHDRAGPLAIGFVIAATLFSLATQAYALGHGAADLSHQLGLSPLVLLVGLLPHALPELRRCSCRSRRGRWPRAGTPGRSCWPPPSSPWPWRSRCWSWPPRSRRG